MTTYLQKVVVTSSSRSGWDSYKDVFEKVFIEENLDILEAKVKAFVKENNFSSCGDFGICLQSSECKVGPIEKYVKVKD